MDFMEFWVCIASIYYSCKFLIKWYRPLFLQHSFHKNRPTRYILGLLPVVSVCIILWTLGSLASFDVIDSSFYILLYTALGIAWISMGMSFLSCFFDLSWLDDALHLNNKAALISVLGGFLGITLMYSGANIGDGPGWWCVVFAGGLGLITWLVLGFIINLFTDIFERITIERDPGCGIRFGAYLLASGFILARACAGDWTSFHVTLIEFTDGWPVLALAILLMFAEQYYIFRKKSEENSTFLFSSIAWGVIFIAFAIAVVYLLPSVSENPIYPGAFDRSLSL